MYKRQTPDDRDLVLAPPFTALSTMAELSQNSRVCLSSQNVHWEGQGAFTGEISPAMLKEHGVTHTIVGHSEPRKYFSESDEQINHRARSSQSNGLIPIVCVGESDEQRERGEAERVIRRQIEQGLRVSMPRNWWWPTNRSGLLAQARPAQPKKPTASVV